MKPSRIVLMYGLGGASIEWWGTGERLFKTRLEALGAHVLLVNWNQRQECYDFLHGFNGFIATAGDSLGAGSAAQYAGDLDRQVDFVGGFQPSMDDTRTVHRGPGDGYIQLPHQVVRAHCFYDPVWYDTLGLGQCHYEVAPGAKTVLLTTQHRGAHPDDWGYTQDIMFNELKGLMQ